MELNLSTIKHVHFIGIGGIGISAIARMMIEEGKMVSGQDIHSGDNTELLKEAGAHITLGQSMDAIPVDADLIVYSRAIEVLEPHFLEQIKSLPIPSLVYPEMLGLVSRDKYTIAISGCHGKTTTTGMVAHMLMKVGADPTVVIGSFLQKNESDTKSNFIQGKSNYFVVEADEYYRAFLNLHPTILVITNIDLDHVDYYKDLDDIKSAYKELVSKVPKEGFVICDIHNDVIKDVMIDCQATIIDSRSYLYDRVLSVPGQHIQFDASLAASVGNVLGYSPSDIDIALTTFKGTARRFEYKGVTSAGALVYDDYAHHPTEIKASLEGFREKFPRGIYTLHVIFQPHLFSRTQAFFNEFVTSFYGADDIVILPIFKARENDTGEVSSKLLADAIQKVNTSTKSLTFEESKEYIKSLPLSSHDVIVTMGAGNAFLVGEALLSTIEVPSL